MRKVDAGLHSCMPIYQNVLIEKTHSERQMDVESVWREEPCEITVSVIWSISDLEDYYTKGGETTAASDIEKQVREALASTEISDIGTEAIQQYLHAALRENSLAFEEFGVKFGRVARSSFRNCIRE
ncbi:MAG: hypothetical protein ACK4HF_17805 [Paracoccaceae bacterium]